MYDIPAVIFAGGKSSRMGEDKALLPFENFSTLSEFQHHKLSLLFNEVYLSSKENKFNFSCQLIKDTHTQSSPLIALISLFETIEDEAVFVLSVDAPLIDDTIIKTLYQNHKKNPHLNAIIAKSPKGLQPLCGIYHRSILPLCYTFMSQNNHKLTALLSKANTQTIFFRDENKFTNLNTPDEYLRFR
ncbi:MAG: molybdenum cofactor guanylyltransferase MobA [Sulfurovum sp.]|nr:MAG: molybdenum cofactor guanylyltransferase MobA [Sulfurovum sp.]